MKIESSQNNEEVKSRATVHFHFLFHPLSILKNWSSEILIQNEQIFRVRSNLIDESLLFERIGFGILNGKPIFDPLSLNPFVIAPVFV